MASSQSQTKDDSDLPITAPKMVHQRSSTEHEFRMGNTSNIDAHQNVDYTAYNMHTSNQVSPASASDHEHHSAKKTSFKHSNKKPQKRKSEAAIYINTAQLFSGDANASTQHESPPLHSTRQHAHKSKASPAMRNGHSQPAQHKRKLKAQRNSHQSQLGHHHDRDKYAPFDFNKSRTPQPQSHSQHQSPSHVHHTDAPSFPSSQQRSLPDRKRAGTLQARSGHLGGAAGGGPNTNTNSNNSGKQQTKGVQFKLNGNQLRPKAVQFTGGTIKFRKSHNNLPIMHPAEIEAIQKSKKHNKDLYKQRASLSAAQFSRHRQKQGRGHKSKASKKVAHLQHKNGFILQPMNMAASEEDDMFLSSLVQPMKKKELNEAIEKLKEVMETANFANLVGTKIEMSLREVIRKLQLLRLDVTLREYRQPAATQQSQLQQQHHHNVLNVNGRSYPSGSISHHQTSEEEELTETTDDEYTHSIYSKLASKKKSNINRKSHNKHKYKANMNAKANSTSPQSAMLAPVRPQSTMASQANDGGAVFVEFPSGSTKLQKSRSMEKLPDLQLAANDASTSKGSNHRIRSIAIMDQIDERKEKEEEQQRILMALSAEHKENEHANEEGDVEETEEAPTEKEKNSFVSAFLFATKFQNNPHFHPSIIKTTKKSADDDDENEERKKKKNAPRIRLRRRRFTLSAATPTDSDRAGIEVARWLSTGYSTFGRYEIPPSPISQPIDHHISPRQQSNNHSTKTTTMKKNKNKKRNNNEEDGNLLSNMKTLTLANDDENANEEGDEGDDAEQRIVEQEEKRRKLFEANQRKMSATKSDVNKFLKMFTSDLILQRLKGIGDDWDWCIFDLHEECGDSILLLTAHYIFEELHLFEKFDINYNKFQAFFSVIQRGYEKNPYHSALHGADVLVNIYYWIKSSAEFRSYLSDLDILIALISAACHDYKHPGLTQNFQISTNSDMALQYNGRSVLENMHCSETIRLLLQPQYEIFGSLKKSEFRYVRELITDMILGTDMQMHSDHVKKSAELCAAMESERAKMEAEKEQNTKHMLVVGLHVADIANPSKPWPDCKRWTYMLMEEWFRQGDKEKALGLDISPMMDRCKPNIPRGQIGFIDYIVKPIFENFERLFVETNICVLHLHRNRANWAALNSDPDANNVQLQLRKSALETQEKAKQMRVDEHKQREKAKQEQERKEQLDSKQKLKKKKKKKKRKKKVEVAVVVADRESVADVPFTPEQAEALHVTYNDIQYAEHDKDKDKIEQPLTD